MEQAGKAGDAAERTGLFTVALAVLIGLFDGAVAGAIVNSVGWWLHDTVDAFRWNTLGFGWGLVGAVVGAAVAVALVVTGRWSPTGVRSYAVRLAWLRGLALALFLQAVAPWEILEVVGSVGVAVAGTLGYFVEANAVARLAVKRFALFAVLVGVVVGAIAGAIVNSLGWWLHGAVEAFRWNNVGAGWALIGALTGGVLAWVFWARRPPSYERRLRIPEKAAPAIFLTPALFFVGLALIVPTIRTIYLSFFGSDSEERVGFDNYRAIWHDGGVINFDGFGDMATARVAVSLIGLLLAFLVVRAGRGLVARASRAGGAVIAGVSAAAVGLLAAVLTGTVSEATVAPVVVGVPAAVLAFLATAEAGRPVVPAGAWRSGTRLVAVVGAGALLLSVATAGDGLGRSRLFVGGMVVLVALVVVVAGRGALTVTRRQSAGTSELVLALVTAGAAGVVGLSTALLVGSVTDAGTTIWPLTLAAVVVAVLAILAGRRTGLGVDISAPGPTLSLTVAAALVLLGAVSSLSGVLWNNIFWVVFVTGLASLFGLGIAVLADRARGESVAKSLIFMPMAISFVGASIIWRFIYAATPNEEQFGLLNALVVNFGGEPQLFVQDRPWNTLFLIAIMIWIQTGFAMVIFSAAIKGVPEELREAARIDGAGEMQTFWRVTLPHIRSTVVVVITTLIVTVLKIYDLVQVMTGGRFGTNVIANQMFDEVFQFRDFGRGSALATLLFLGVVPLMIANVRRVHQQEEVR